MDKKRVINAAVTAGLSLSMIMTSVPATALAEGDQTDNSTAVEQLSTMKVGVNYWDVENNEQVCEGSIEVASDATSVNTSALVDVPEGYELVVTGDIQIMGGWIFVKIQPASTITVEVNYWDTVNNKQAGTGYVTVDADAYNVNSSLLTDIPYGYELINTGDIAINDGYLYVQVKPAATKEVGVNYYDAENGVQVYEGTVTVAGDATNVNSSQLTDIPEGYELVVTGDYQINDRWIYVEVKRAATQTVGVNYYDVVNNEQVCESEITVSSDDNNVNSSQLTDIPEGYELVVTGDFAITDGWIFVSLRPITTQTVGINYYDVENNVQVAESEITVPYGENNVNSSQLTDIPEGYELVVVGDYAITDGWIYVPVRPVATTQDVVVSYVDQDSGEEVGTQNVTVDADDWKVNSSAMTDVPEGYELVEVGDFFIEDGKVTVYVKKSASEEPVETTYDVTFNYCLTNTENLVVTVKEGETVEAPTDPTCPGYTFTGWYVDPERTQLYDFDSPVYEDMTLYAGWEEAADEGGETTTPDDTTPGDTTDETVTPVEPAATDETTESDELPKTGDTTNNAAVVGVGIAGLIAAAASVILRRRNQQ